MKRKTIVLISFCLLCAVQLFFPAQIVFQHEATLSEGKPWKFKVQPVDPSDPFRGKYITLRFEQDDFDTSDTTQYVRGEKVYVTLKEDTSGYAQLTNISREIPDTPDYIIASVRYYRNGYSKGKEFRNLVQLDLPFDRFYMEESKAQPAEDVMRENRRSNNLDCYALVKVDNGNTVLENVFINDVPIDQYIHKGNEVD